MSEKNVELMRRAWDPYLRGDLRTTSEFWDPEIVWDMTHFRDWPDRMYHGREGAARFLSEWLEVWGDYEVGVDEIIAAPDGRIVTLAWQRGQGRESGLTMDMQWAMIATIRAGKVTRIENYDDRSKALEAAGLSL